MDQPVGVHTINCKELFMDAKEDDAMTQYNKIDVYKRQHLHTHTEYSTLDGMARIEELIITAKSFGQTGIAITDHGSSSGLYSAWKLGKKHDFNVLLGEEFYFENDIEDLKTGHLILIAKNEEGLKNIFRLQRMAYDNFYYKPRINLDMLKECHEGLVCTCLLYTSCNTLLITLIAQFFLLSLFVFAICTILKRLNILHQHLNLLSKHLNLLNNFIICHLLLLLCHLLFFQFLEILHDETFIHIGKIVQNSFTRDTWHTIFCRSLHQSYHLV